MKNCIFYFSATGNSLQVAGDIAKHIGECEVINLAKYNMDTMIQAERVGIIFPVFSWGIPNIVRTFLSKIEFDSTSYLFAVVTYGTSAGSALLQADETLKAHGYKLHSGFQVKMPESYAVLFSALDKGKQQKLFVREKAIVDRISKIILESKEQPLERSKFVIDRLLGKAFNHREVVIKAAQQDYHFNVNDNCIGCGKCARVCSVDNIILDHNKPNWNHHCEFCFGCYHHCPINAINYKNLTQKKLRYTNPNVKL